MLLIAIIAICALLSQVSWADEEFQGIVATIGFDAQGRVLFETESDFQRDWSVLSVGDWLTLEDDIPDASGEPLECVQNEWDGKTPGYAVLLRHPGASRACSFPMNPTGHFYVARFGNGGQVILRLHQDFPLEHGLAAYEDERVAFEPISVLEACQIQTHGDQAVRQLDKRSLDIWVAMANCYSFIAAETGEGQAAALDFAAQVTERALLDFLKRHSRLPGGLCQISTGEDAIVSGLPLNPYQWPQSLCTSDFGTPRPQGALRYIPERGSDGVTIIGFWLAIIGNGKTSSPRRPVPLDVANPLRAIKWLEFHSSEQIAVNSPD